MLIGSNIRYFLSSNCHLLSEEVVDTTCCLVVVDDQAFDLANESFVLVTVDLLISLLQGLLQLLPPHIVELVELDLSPSSFLLSLLNLLQLVPDGEVEFLPLVARSIFSLALYLVPQRVDLVFEAVSL